MVLQLAAQVVEAETGSLLLLDEKSNELVFDIALGDAGKELKTIRLKMGEGIAGWVAKENKPLIVNDPNKDPRWTKRGDQKTKFVTRSILCVPMNYQKKLMGVVQAINRKGEKGFSEDDRALLEAFASQAAVAIQNARLFSSVREEKEKVETIFSQMTEGAAFCNEDGQLLLANPAALHLLGLPEKDYSGTSLWKTLQKMECTPPPDMLKTVKDSQVSFEAVRKEGKTLVVSGMIKKISSDRGGRIGHLVVMRDVTAEKKEEKIKRDFLSLMSHKLKTPLVAITGYTPMLLEEEEVLKAQPFFRKAITAIHEQGMHLKQLVEKLISFSMVEAQDLKVETKPYEVTRLLEDILTSMTTYIGDEKARVILGPSIKTLPPILVDYDKFKEVMKGLIENGVKFNRNEAKEVVVSGRHEASRIFLSVKDNGPGIPGEELDKIFQKFYQVEESFTGQVEGAGLGLALVKRMVEMHGGAVKVISALGKGSTFTVDFPAKA
ncbi:MAG: hypothetical protein A2901_08665 [Elusimicrobia bacterium RIFCSPLOWO2_01_FULL_54_10]|nr:MAG: hypothetical protein A2901_08665 [Elusimicrobia bacterium RIFCSPLOWO2_01_FULL_54_10]